MTLRNTLIERYLTIILMLLPVLCYSQSIQRIEPPNWWVDMKTNTIQLLIYGENISAYQVKVNHSDVSIDKTVSTANPNYLFVYLNIPTQTKPTTVNLEFYDGKRKKLTQPYALKAREAGRATIEGFNSSDVMYLITPDRFANGNPDNDNVDGMKESANRTSPGGRHGGDLKGISDHLDYFTDMGFTALWINPMIENDMPAYSYHGYAATDFYKMDARYGSNEDYKKFVDKARSKNVKIIIDMIANHCGSSHWFVLDPPTKDWINYGGEFKPTTHRRSTNQDIHASAYDKKAFADGWFVSTMPDLNQRNPLMAEYLIQNTIWWIEYSGISGIRMDTYPYPDKNFMSDWTFAVMNEYHNFSIVGEEWSLNPAIVSYWQRDKINHDGYISCMNSLMDFPLQNGLVEALKDTVEGWNTGMIKAYHALANDFLYPHPDELVIFPDNHDMDRLYTQVNENDNLFKMGLIYMFTVRGIPQIYYGTEIAMTNTGYLGDHGIIRTDFPGGWEGDDVNAFTGAGLSEKQKGFQQFTKKLLNWRKNATVIHTGKLTQFAPENGVYSFIRHNEEENVLVIFNNNLKEATVEFSKYDELLKGMAKGIDVIENTSINMTQPYTMKGKTALILEVK